MSQSIVRTSALILTMLIGSVHAQAVKDAISPAPPLNFESRYAEVNGVTMHYVIGGKGPALVLIHGWPETWYSWRKMMPILAHSHTVLALDMRGMGDSSPEAGGYDKKTLANDVYQLLSKLKLSHIDLVGHDWGGPVGYALAVQHPDAVRKLVLLEGAPFGPWMGKELEPYWFFHVLRLPNGYAESLITGREAQFLSYFYNNTESHVVPVFGADVVDVYTKAYARPGRMVASYGLYRTIDQDVRDNAAFSQIKLTIPVLAIGAEKGAGEHIAQFAGAVAENVTPMVFKDTGHFIPEERPEALSETIEACLLGKKLPPTWSP